MVFRVVLVPPMGATCSNCGKTLKPQLPSRRVKTVGGQVNSLGYGNNAKDVTMGDPQPISFQMDVVQRLDVRGFGRMRCDQP